MFLFVQFFMIHCRYSFRDSLSWLVFILLQFNPEISHQFIINDNLTQNFRLELKRLINHTKGS